MPTRSAFISVDLMQWIACLGSVAILVAPDAVSTLRAAEIPAAKIYDSDPAHLWNRIHATFMLRQGPDGKWYGHDRLEPLLWTESQHFREGPELDRARSVLHEFLRDHGETLINDPLKRVLLQHDLWMIANWLGQFSDRNELLVPLTKVIRSLAVPADQTSNLPDNYAAAATARAFPTRFDGEHPDHAYLPPDLFDPTGPWVCIGRTDGRTAPLHLQSHANNSFTNSTFFVLLKLPGGRAATLDYLKRLARLKEPLFVNQADVTTAQPNPNAPQLPSGTELALLRRAMVIDPGGNVIASPLTESVQLRVLHAAHVPKTANEARLTYDEVRQQMSAFEFQLLRADLFANRAGGLRDISTIRDFKTGFASHRWDEFERLPGNAGTAAFSERAQPFPTNHHACLSCHATASIYGTMSFQRYAAAREKFTETSPTLFPIAEMPIVEVERAAVRWKTDQAAWKAIRSRWDN